MINRDEIIGFRLLGRRVISKGRGSTRRRRNIQLLWRRQSLRIHTAAAAMDGKGAVATTATNIKASHRQRRPQLLLITEQPREGREFPTGPQWEDSSLNIKGPPSTQYFCLIILKYTPVYRVPTLVLLPKRPVLGKTLALVLSLYIYIICCTKMQQLIECGENRRGQNGKKTM